MQRILISGATGFIGYRVALALQERGYKVLGMKRRGNAHLPKGCIPVLGDVRDPEIVTEAILRSDIVIHLAAIVGNASCDQDLECAVNVNINGTLNFLDTVRNSRKPMIFASVGNIEDNTGYAITKATAERFCLMYNREFGTHVLPLRIFNIYGPGQSPTSGKLIANSIEKALRGEDLVMFGDGEQKNDFVYVDDVAEVMAEAVRHLSTVTVPPAQAMDLGTGIGTSVKEVLNRILTLTGRKSKVVQQSTRPGEKMAAVVADKSRSFVPERFTFTSLDAGLQRTIGEISREVTQ